MKNLKVSSLFHWLYGAVMFLPILLLPVFMIYSHRHEINSGSIEVPQTIAVDFNQLYDLNSNTYGSFNGVTFTKQEHGVLVNGTADSNIFFGYRLRNFVDGHVYLLKNSNTSFDGNFYLYGTDNLSNVNVKYVIGSSQSFVFTSINGNTDYRYYIAIMNGKSVSNVYVIPQIYDLTQMFGSGNEPSIDEFNQLFPQSYYDYVLSHKELVDGDLVTYDDTDIMSQMTYQLYNAVDKYFNIGQFFGFENLWDYMVLNWFGGNVTIYLRIFWQLLTYWLVVSIAWLIFDLFMYVPKLAHRWLDRSAIE